MAVLVFNRWKKCSLLFLFSLSAGALMAQFKVTLRIKNYANLKLSDTFYVAGDFNNWNPRDAKYQLVKKNEAYSIVIENACAGAHEFKITRGAWSRVETNNDGTNIENRKFQLAGDTAIEITVEGWSNEFASSSKLHTASPRVSIMDSAFEIPGLSRTRKVWLYLPEGYNLSKKRYPVIYMQDGQNIFDDFTAPFSEWGVDEWIDSLVASGKPACIVVGIENGPKRMTEYNPFQNDKFDTGEGRQYTDFIVSKLKPYIDEHYKTLPEKGNTMIAGSSMGGLISYYAMLKYPEVFGKAGIFSPAFWTAPGIGDFTDSLANRVSGKFFFYAGTQEGQQYIEQMKIIQEKLGKKSGAMLYSVIDSTGKHNETAWKKWFGEFYCWISASGFNIVTKAGD